MDFYAVLDKRRSIRAYKNDPIPKDSLDKIARAVNNAPSACNLQPWSFRVVIDQTIKDTICRCYQAPWLKQAPAIILALGNLEACWKRPEGTPITDIDVGIAMEHLVLAATAEGLGTCWICAYQQSVMDKAVNILKPWTTLAISPLGYPDESPEMPKRKPLAEVFKVV